MGSLLGLRIVMRVPYCLMLDFVLYELLWFAMLVSVCKVLLLLWPNGPVLRRKTTSCTGFPVCPAESVCCVVAMCDCVQFSLP